MPEKMNEKKPKLSFLYELSEAPESAPKTVYADRFGNP